MAVPDGANLLWDALNELLDRVVIALGDTNDGPPACRYISEGPPVWDAVPSLVVWAGAPALADTFPLQPSLAPGHRATVQGQVNLVTITTTILRCATTLDNAGKTPPPAAHAAVAQQISQDIWAIWNHLNKAKRAGLLFAPRERELFFDPAQPMNQEGGACGWQIPIRVQLDGYMPSIYVT